MKKHITHILVLFLWTGFISAQNNNQTIDYNKLLKYKVDENRFNFGWLKNVFSGIPCFRDYTEDKTEMQLIDPKTDSIIYKSTEPEINGLKIIPEKISLDKKVRKFQIKGQITGGWESVIPLEFEIYIGHRKDTISNITLSPNLHGDVYYNGKKVDSTIVVDVVPSFYMTNIKKFVAYRSVQNLPNSSYKQMLFDIEAVIDEKSILVFGLSSRYAEIFEIGKLLTE
ncbi:hypothetical protein [Flavobacterium sp. SLB02]|uniref:hypothetical protein n=1 Tax=Flavobacterium sp. SLB02 TaxID=2665645 RepID=UPI0012A93A21|nr:hypothetical protein [Flavobacterium sp. SLB02]QGK74416.1 hypothetical protein GIY83_10220 [Flavobacterium sp. SLB02]